VAKDMCGGPEGQIDVPDGCFEKAFIEAAGRNVNDRTFITFGGLPPGVERQRRRVRENYRAKFHSDPRLRRLRLRRRKVR